MRRICLRACTLLAVTFGLVADQPLHSCLVPPSQTSKRGPWPQIAHALCPQRSPDWNLATGPNTCFKQKTSAYFRFVFHTLIQQPAKHERVNQIVYNQMKFMGFESWKLALGSHTRGNVEPGRLLLSAHLSHEHMNRGIIKSSKNVM